MAKGGERLVLAGDPVIEVCLRRSAQTRRLSLRVSQLDGRVTLSMPKKLKLQAAEEFLAEKADWVRGHLSARPRELDPCLGSMVPVEGRDRLIVPGPGRLVALTPDGGLQVAPNRPVAPQVAGFLKALARERLAEACDRYAHRLGRPYGRLTLRDTRSRWGSCTSSGNLMFSWRLAMAPPEVLDYVAAHEVAHLQEMNHSEAFWQVVEGLCPDYRAQRRWLHSAGTDLHMIRFPS
ncbi:M48 family metallopeptidase [Pseudoruegeria sp. SK021]|uniref:M48 family metallopeptidase n=1 Tax=Pseudoruegeria sp. SK021 TaxID=1933035 RepID=UPI000A241181|nr:SprT family zinc-dependent metalloprotease [Pseudoruegeria sp. SK021]OSP56116.1 zinc metalloprotease [Pseudoruegeria sp. SK021]